MNCNSYVRVSYNNLSRCGEFFNGRVILCERCQAEQDRRKIIYAELAELNALCPRDRLPRSLGEALGLDG